MKINGKKIEPPKALVVVIPRQEEDIVLKCQPVLDFEEFDMRCPRPEMPDKILKGGIRVPDPDNPKYQEKLNDWVTKRTNWIFIKSLEATEGLEWEAID